MMFKASPQQNKKPSALLASAARPRFAAGFSASSSAGSSAGFSLVEISVVLVVIGLILVGLLPALSATQRSTAATLTRQNLETLTRSTAAFVQANGCLPCPTPPASIAGAGRGFVAGVAAGPLCAACAATPEGIPPFRALGLTEQQARDGWGRFFTMRIDPALSTNFGIVPPASPCLASDLPPNPVTPTCLTLNASQKGLCRAGLVATNRISVTSFGTGTSTMALLLLSHGANGTGALIENGTRRAFPAAQPACNTVTGVGYERCNADNNLIFAVRDTVISDTDPYDDQHAAFNRDALVSYLGSGACQTSW